MLNTSKNNIQNTDMNKDILWDFCKHSETELDYEYAESLLEISAGKSEVSTKSNTSTAVIDSSLPKLADTVLQQQKGSDVKFKFQTNERQLKTADVLNLHRMAEKLAEDKANLLKKVEKIIYETRGLEYDIVAGVDKLLEEAHTICDTFRNKLDSGTRAKLLNLIANLKELPHMYEHIHRGKLKYDRVVTWLNSSASRPGPEMCGLPCRTHSSLESSFPTPDQENLQVRQILRLASGREVMRIMGLIARAIFKEAVPIPELTLTPT